jgi:hypothetical protein
VKFDVDLPAVRGHDRVMTKANDVYDAILEMRRGNGAVVLLTYRGDW